MRVTYDSEADAAYVYLTDEPLSDGRDTTACEFPESVGGAMVNLDWKDGRVVGLEVLDASKLLYPDLIDTATGDGVVVLGPDGGSVVTFSGSFDPYKDGYDFRDFKVHIADEGLTATTMVRSMETANGLAAFVGSLVADWKGWNGERKWESIEHDMGLTASHDGLGTITLRVEVRSDPYPTRWTASTTVRLAAGEELTRFAQRITHLLS